MHKSYCSINSLKATITATLMLLISTVYALLPSVGFAAINVDGRLDEPEWSDAQVFREFVVIDPSTLDSPRVPTEARMVSLPEGLAVAFICDQPPEETRTRTTTIRDADFNSDYVSFMIDFDASHQVAYEFSVSITGSYRDGIITGESSYNYDWDGVWERAVNEETNRWTVEILLPWSIAAMREGSGGKRQMAVYFQRVLNSRNEKYSFPAIISGRKVFMSEFANIEVAEYKDQQLDIIPYVSVFSDMVKDSYKGKAGFDLFWKPSGEFQVMATANPDFGQVESDDLVINFTAIETRFSDKRPFFTENQGLLATFIPPGNSLIHTRRIGGESDDRSGPADIDGALKIIGSTDTFDYGVLAAQEADDAGRSFYAGRINLPKGNWSVGLTTTYVDRPFLDRQANVESIDYTLKMGKVFASGMFIISNIDEKNKNKRGYGGYTTIRYTPSENWYYWGEYTRFDDELDFNDMGYMDCNNFEEIYLNGQWRQTNFSEDSRKASVSWTGSIKLRRNNEWKLLNPGGYLGSMIQFSRSEKLKSGSDIRFSFSYAPSAYDDLISRGHGVVYVNDRIDTSLSYSTQRRGIWSRSLTLGVFQEGYDDWATSLQGTVSLYPHEDVTLDFDVTPLWSRDWLRWMHDDLLASFSRRQLTTDIIANWFPAEKHEVRLRAQWVVINADIEQAFRIGPDARLVPSNDIVNSFAALNFGLQLRYRYEIAPLSYFYLVYSRGGTDNIDNPDKSSLGLFGESTSLRASDQIMAKLSYRF